MPESGRAKRHWIVNSSSPVATDSGNGTRAQPFLTISAAASVALSGDTVLVSGGTVYRERVAPARGGEPGLPITYTSASQEGPQPVVRGSEPLRASSWTRRHHHDNTANSTAGASAGGVVWEGDLEDLPFEQINGGVFNPYAIRVASPANESRADRDSWNNAACLFGNTLGQ